MLGAALLTANVAQGQYTFVQDTDNAGMWSDPAQWTSPPPDDYPNAVGATVLINAPTRTGSGNYNLTLPTNTAPDPPIDVIVGEIKIDNTNYANTYRTNFANGGGRLIFEASSGAAKYTETIGSAPGATNSQYQFLLPVELRSDFLVTQDNYPNLNTGTTFSNLFSGASNLTMTKEGHGGIQFNYNHIPGLETPFQGQVVINQGGIRLISVNPFSNVTGVTVNSGGQLMLADNGNNTSNADWNFASGAVLNLNGTGKATDSPQSVTNPEGALRITVGQITSTNVNNPIVLQSDSVISVPTGTITGTLTNTVSGAGGLIKHGLGTLVLSNGANSYSGDTTLMADGGKLSITNPFLANGADVYLNTGTIFDLNFSGTDVVDSFFIDGVSQATGTWGASAGPGVDHVSPLITGTGLLEVTTMASPFLEADFDNSGAVDGADFATWKAGFGNATGQAKANGDADEDADVDGADFLVWQSQFGSPGAVASGGAIPEPATALLALAAAPLATLVRRKR